MKVVNKHQFDFDTVTQDIVRDTRIPYLKRRVAQYTKFQKNNF